MICIWKRIMIEWKRNRTCIPGPNYFKNGSEEWGANDDDGNDENSTIKIY